MSALKLVPIEGAKSSMTRMTTLMPVSALEKRKKWRTNLRRLGHGLLQAFRDEMGVLIKRSPGSMLYQRQHVDGLVESITEADRQDCAKPMAETDRASRPGIVLRALVRKRPVLLGRSCHNLKAATEIELLTDLMPDPVIPEKHHLRLFSEEEIGQCQENRSSKAR